MPHNSLHAILLTTSDLPQDKFCGAAEESRKYVPAATIAARMQNILSFISSVFPKVAKKYRPLAKFRAYS
jgi:hypothetical protein